MMGNGRAKKLFESFNIFYCYLTLRKLKRKKKGYIRYSLVPHSRAL